MKMTLERKPFNEFWMNCMLNQAFSIAASAHPSYHNAAYLNIYRYYPWVAATDKEFRYPTIDTLYYLDDWTKFPLTGVIKLIEPGHFRNKETFTEEIKEVLRGGRNLSVNVDLYYWLPGSMAWRKFHWYHYSLFNGYDEERSSFYVIDDTLAGYSEHEVPEERLRKAFLNAEYNINENYTGPAYYIYNLHSTIEPYELQLSEVVENAERLERELGEFSIEGMWNVDSSPDKYQSHITYALIGINIICNRHTANEGLIRTLREQKLLKESSCDFLMDQLLEVKNGWEAIKQAFVTHKFDRERELGLAKDLFAKERVFWGSLARSE
ncbi:BtrH N-terminal domain-containing protein [Paenibacillus sp. L3-i20]|uniref:BtrH N-terminal domain-containing protein n=1 Tax=Paenibacillus sp. L3-i20 TaxID=2905833 RepID=UPI001EE14CAB|nr:BtrH N-terminal domain-containing protein [Paenibacillus sp. L3-i20]GKU77861.1 hypothetical protein L3i20_v222580 [Paenibacillus sp. L3-i20]